MLQRLTWMVRSVSVGLQGIVVPPCSVPPLLGGEGGISSSAMLQQKDHEKIVKIQYNRDL